MTKPPNTPQTAPEEELKVTGQSDFENAWRECASQVFLDNTARAFFGRGWDAAIAELASHPLLPEGGEGERIGKLKAENERLRHAIIKADKLIATIEDYYDELPSLTPTEITIQNLVRRAPVLSHPPVCTGEGVGEEVRKEIEVEIGKLNVWNDPRRERIDNEIDAEWQESLDSLEAEGAYKTIARLAKLQLETIQEIIHRHLPKKG